jgi:hypothetical protein
MAGILEKDFSRLLESPDEYFTAHESVSRSDQDIWQGFIEKKYKKWSHT